MPAPASRPSRHFSLRPSVTLLELRMAISEACASGILQIKPRTGCVELVAPIARR
jgi:hypothetical protein